MSGRSAAWIAHLPWAQGVGGSNPLAPTKMTLRIQSIETKHKFFFLPDHLRDL